jgi:hypothetical protein
MQINDKNYTLLKLKLMDLNAITPLKIVKMWDEETST